MKKPVYPYKGMSNEDVDVALSMWASRNEPLPCPPGHVRVPLAGGTYPERSTREEVTE